MNGDGLVDVAVHYDAPYEESGHGQARHRAWAFLRSSNINTRLTHDPLGLDLDMVGARSIDEAVRLAQAAHQSVTPVNVKEACALLDTAATVAGFRRAAGPGAKIVQFSEPGFPALADRVVSSAAIKYDDLGKLREPQCPPLEEDDMDALFSCKVALCGHFGTTLGNFFRFVRIGGKLKIDRAVLYHGE